MAQAATGRGTAEEQTLNFFVSADKKHLRKIINRLSFAQVAVQYRSEARPSTSSPETGRPMSSTTLNRFLRQPALNQPLTAKAFESLIEGTRDGAGPARPRWRQR
ncbi:MAG: hypothetical protein IV092_22955 [Burkholderiaceae bacterium]|nr:hypothetical protein [Burkholderiaceae bacterium]